MRRPIFLIAMIAMAGLAWAAGAGGQASSAPARGVPEASWDKYRVLTTRNIFLRDRSRPVSARPVASEDRKPADRAEPASGLVLTGVGQSGSIRVAVLEDLRSEKILQAVAGESVDGGRVVEVGMDGIVYERRGATRRIGFGQDLSGQAVSDLAATTQPATGAPGQPASQPAGGGAPAGLSELERRMRERRARE